MKKVKNDLTGKRFGRLSVIGVDDRETRKTYYICRCDCGKMKSVRSDSLLCGAIRSCGCLKKEQDESNLDRTSHNLSKTKLYRTWQGMKERCYDSHNARFDRYGGRGITVCEEWKNDFLKFHEWAINSGYEDHLTIDRINNDKGYSPDNCRWADAETQARNRSSNIKITIGNATKSLREWCEIFQLDYGIIHARYKRNGFRGIDDLFNR